MRFPNIPLELNVLLGSYPSHYFILQRLHLHQAVEVGEFMEAVVEVVVVALRVEVYHCCPAELTRFRFVDDDILHWHDVLKELLQVFTGDLEVQVGQQAFIDEIRLHHFFHRSTSA